MIVSSSNKGWQKALADAIRDPRLLLRQLSLPENLFSWEPDVDFPLLVPESYLRRMQPGNPDDPLLRQVLPVAEENRHLPGFVDDPVSDSAARRAPGLLHKYRGRALLIIQGACAVHCRYCFRRHYPYLEEPKSWSAWEPALAELQQDASLSEVILSGGDPLVSSDERLAQLIGRLAGIPHLKRLRIHSRLPVVLPERITPSLIRELKGTRLQTIMVIHANHGQELTADCAEAIRLLVESGLPVLNQAVLLKGVNDSLEALAELCEKSVNLGVIPYYLHQLDRVQGAAHFEVPPETGRKLIRELRRRLPGYAVPEYVTEIPGADSKTPL